jgi:hypothetical protein
MSGQRMSVFERLWNGTRRKNPINRNTFSLAAGPHPCKLHKAANDLPRVPTVQRRPLCQATRKTIEHFLDDAPALDLGGE